MKKTGKPTSACKECIRAGSQRWRANNPGRNYTAVRDWRMRKLFGTTVEQYEQMLAEQGGACAICGAAPHPVQGLAVDHCHRTGAVRGMLCSKCNRGIGFLKENPQPMRRAADYVRFAP